MHKAVLTLLRQGNPKFMVDYNSAYPLHADKFEITKVRRKFEARGQLRSQESTFNPGLGTSI